VSSSTEHKDLRQRLQQFFEWLAKKHQEANDSETSSETFQSRPEETSFKMSSSSFGTFKSVVRPDQHARRGTPWIVEYDDTDLPDSERLTDEDETDILRFFRAIYWVPKSSRANSKIADAIRKRLQTEVEKAQWATKMQAYIYR